MLKLFLILICSMQFISAQSLTVPDNVENTALNVYNGITEAVSWYDIPVFAFKLSRIHLQFNEDKKPFRITPFEFEKDLQQNLGASGRFSGGSIDENIIPYSIMGARLLYSLSANLIDPSAVSKDNYKNIALMYKSIVYTHFITSLAKSLVHKNRPDGEDSRSFFSGHASSAFAAVSYLYRETDDYLDNWEVTRNNDLLRVGLKSAGFTALYGWAGYVACSRLSDNKHYLMDVLLGAAVGTAAANIIYELYNEDETAVLRNFSVGADNNGPSLNFTLNF